MRAAVLLLLGLVGLVAGAGKVRKLAGINGYISDHPDERCKKIGEFLLHPYNRCSYLVCDYGHEPWKDDYGRTKYYARIMKCAPGTAVPMSAYRNGQHKLDPTKVCTQHYSGHCPAPVSSYSGNFYGGSHYTPRHKLDMHDSYDSYDSHKPSQGYGLKGGHSYEERYPSRQTHSFMKIPRYEDHDKNNYGDSSFNEHSMQSYGKPSHRPSYGGSAPSSHSSSRYGSQHHGSSYGSKPSSGYRRPSSGYSGGYSRPRPSSSHGRPSSRGRFLGGRRPSHRGSRGRHGFRRPSLKPRYSSYRPSYRNRKPSFGGSYSSYGYSQTPGLSFKKAADSDNTRGSAYDPEPAASRTKESSYNNQKPSRSSSSYRRESYPRPSYPKHSKDSYNSKESSFEKASYPSKPSSYERESFPSKPSYTPPGYANAPSDIKYPDVPRDISYPSSPNDISYPSAPKNVKYPESPGFSKGGFNEFSKGGGNHNGPAPSHNRPVQYGSMSARGKFQSARNRPQYLTPPENRATYQRQGYQSGDKQRQQHQVQRRSYGQGEQSDQGQSYGKGRGYNQGQSNQGPSYNQGRGYNQGQSNQGPSYNQGRGYNQGQANKEHSYSQGKAPQGRPPRRHRPRPTGQPGMQSGHSPRQY